MWRKEERPIEASVPEEDFQPIVEDDEDTVEVGKEGASCVEDENDSEDESVMRISDTGQRVKVVSRSETVLLIIGRLAEG